MASIDDVTIGRSAPQRRRRSSGRGRPVVPLAALIVLAAGAAAFVGYVLWPRWPAAPATADAPALPITVGGILFNVPPAAIRVPLQRKPGAQERLDLVFLWPSLAPPDPTAKTSAPPAERPAPSPIVDRLFVTIAQADTALGPAERVKAIYPRYVTGEPERGPADLAVLAFSDNSPYRGEDLIYEGAAPANFLVRCTRSKGPTPGTCLHERRVDTIDSTVRFPRDWLTDWRPVATGIERLLKQLRSTRG
jgi:hypothetical protein